MSDVLNRGDYVTDSTRNNHVRAQCEGGHLQAMERDLEETKPANTLILVFQPPELGQNMPSFQGLVVLVGIDLVLQILGLPCLLGNMVFGSLLSFY